MTQDVEYWSSYPVKVCYEEEWDEYIHQTCTRTYTDSDGNTQTETYDCSYVDNHPEEYYILTNIGETIYIDRNKYKWYVKRFGNEHFQDMYRDYHRIDGDMYYTNHDGKFETIDPITTIHSYENKVAVSNSIFNFEKVDTSIYKELFDYPEVNNYKVNSILTQTYNAPNLKDALYTLNKHNAVLGNSRQCRIWFLIYDNKPFEYAIQQENYWKGGNKNEFIVTLSLSDSNTVQWAKIISWTEVEELKIRIRNYLLENKFDTYKAVQYTTDEVKQRFIRKKFEDFDYLTVEPSMTSILIVFILNIILNVGIVIFVVKNDIDNTDNPDMNYKYYNPF